MHVAHAGVMTSGSLARVFPSPLIVGEKEKDLPVWPILKQEMTSTSVVAYAFESIDLAPIPGFSGTPFNLLIALDANGSFMDVRVLSQHEPVFLDGLGEKPLLAFVEQYKNLSLKQGIKITKGEHHNNDAVVYIDGVTKATASVRILNQSLLSASLKVARAKLGYGQARDPDMIGKVRLDVFSPLDWRGIVRRDLAQRTVFKNQQIEAAFVNTSAEGEGLTSQQSPDDVFLETYVTALNVPSVGKNLLSPEQWQYIQQRLEPGDQALLVLWKGAYSLLSDDFVRGTVSDRLTLYQQSLPIEMRDMDLDVQLKLPAEMQDFQWRVFRVIAPAGLDPSQPLTFKLNVTRSKGIIYPELVRRDFEWTFQIPADYVISAQEDQKNWRTIWRDRAWELFVLVSGLAVLAWALSSPAWLTRSPQRLALFRNGYLLFTLVFIGWYAQGQLSIVNFTAAIQSVVAAQSLAFFLYDPMTVVLWIFVMVSLVVWGRGTFCGWLCPFGALQELLSKFTRQLGLKWRVVPARWDARLKKIKYVLWLVIVVSSVISVNLTDRMVEVEPFKTSITLMFVRSWPFVVWAALALLASCVYYKAYCRYLCPLGGGLALLGQLRRIDWIARRSECGQPCQRCRHDCAYQAIHRDGRIHYEECFQCLDCVVIHDSKTLCVPLILQARSSSKQESQS
jgi:transcriptional regulator of nitric oxide reductase